MLGHVQDAALENVERTVHASAMANRFDNRDDMPESQSYHQDYSNNIPQHSSEEHVSRNHGPPVLAPPATVMRQRHPNFEQYANQHNQATNPSGLQSKYNHILECINFGHSTQHERHELEPTSDPNGPTLSQEKASLMYTTHNSTAISFNIIFQTLKRPRRRNVVRRALHSTMICCTTYTLMFHY